MGKDSRNQDWSGGPAFYDCVPGPGEKSGFVVSLRPRQAFLEIQSEDISSWSFDQSFPLLQASASYAWNDGRPSPYGW